MIPERLITIRRYDSTELAVRDCRLLIADGFDAYIRTYRWDDVAEIRVPESQVEEALQILPPVEPELLAPRDGPAVCPWCGSHEARYPSTLARILSLAGVAAAAWLAVQRQFEAAGLVLVITLIAIYFAKIGSGLVCANCGGEWRAPRAAPDPDSEN